MYESVNWLEIKLSLLCIQKTCITINYSYFYFKPLRAFPFKLIKPSGSSQIKFFFIPSLLHIPTQPTKLEARSYVLCSLMASVQQDTYISNNFRNY